MDQPNQESLGKLWFYEPATKNSLTSVGGKIPYRFRRFRIYAWLLAFFGPIAFAFLAHGIHWDVGAATLLSIALTIAGWGSYTFIGESVALKKYRSKI